MYVADDLWADLIELQHEERIRFQTETLAVVIAAGIEAIRKARRFGQRSPTQRPQNEEK